jgi:hypothetical protein
MEIITEKTCSKCGEIKSASQFYPDKGMRNKIGSYCKDCARINRRKIHLKSYGLTPSDYQEMHLAQNGKCAICGSFEFLHIDHCHKTGQVRGLLCNTCNKGIGHLQDSVVVMGKAIAYLNKW